MGKGRRGPKHMWEVGQGEKGRSSPALCLLGADPSPGSHRALLHCDVGPRLPPGPGRASQPQAPHSFHGPPAGLAFLPPTPAQGKVSGSPTAQKVLTSTRCDTYFRGRTSVPVEAPACSWHCGRASFSQE